MIISSQHLERLKQMLHDTPLSGGELRKVDWVGEQYITFAETPVDSAGFTYQYELVIDERSYRVYAKNTIRSAHAG